MKPQRGVVTDGIYRNEFFKVAFPVKEGSVILDDRTDYEQVKAGGVLVTEADCVAYASHEDNYTGRDEFEISVLL